MINFKQIKRELIYRMPPKTAHSILYLRSHNGHLPDFKNPKTYDEKIHWHIINTYGPEYGKYADKYQVRAYVKECGLQNLLIPLVGGPYDTFDDIDFDALPEEFVLKTNHASGGMHYYICEDKQKLDREALRKQMTVALKENHVKKHCEYHYAGIKPRIICEKLLHDSTDRLTDYKVVCSYGKPLAILVCFDRDQGRDYYSTDWTYLNYTKEKYRSGIQMEKPDCLTEMLAAAGRLSEPFPLSRIDFYIAENRLYFGEITLTPSYGCHRNLTPYAELELGKQFPPNESDHNR
jgi:hypothetical protein